MTGNISRNIFYRTVFAFTFIFIFLAILIFWNLSSGSVSTSFFNVIKILLKKSDSSDALCKVIWTIRFPRVLSALLLGGALSVSGLLLQIFFSNPIAGPYVLGISSGAKLSVALAMIFLLSRGVHLNSLGMVGAAFLGSMLAILFVLILSFRVKSMSVLVVCGILVGYICSAVTDFFITFASDSNIVNLHNWSLGSFSGMNWNDVKIITFIVIPVSFFAFLLSKPIGAFLLGENYARSVGVNIKLLRVLLILLSSLLSSCVTAFAGPVSFVGIAVPHLVKSVLKTSKPRVLIPACFFAGSAIMVFCDGIARTVLAPTEFSISTVTAILLVPVVIWMMLKREGRR
ncbi:FecCD family ABC transporter permease [Treponema zioleckii]|uniref:FecCD family ABC transporter permease n=1 Tax=Treponema zioleckii TaxID=331680 RepID=UPI00168BF7A4|nr:iron ABC transporter permease [Treponema zioleckii]